MILDAGGWGCVCVLDYITHNAYTQVRHSLAYYVHIPRRDHYMHLVVHDTHSMCPRRDYNLAQKYSRDRSRRT